MHGWKVVRDPGFLFYLVPRLNPLGHSPKYGRLMSLSEFRSLLWFWRSKVQIVLLGDFEYGSLLRASGLFPCLGRSTYRCKASDLISAFLVVSSWLWFGLQRALAIFCRLGTLFRRVFSNLPCQEFVAVEWTSRNWICVRVAYQIASG